VVILRSLDMSQDRQCLIDSLPIPAVQIHLVPASTGDWKAYQATFGNAITKKQTFWLSAMAVPDCGCTIGDFVVILLCGSGDPPLI
jgi:hypothetical protein